MTEANNQSVQFQGVADTQSLALAVIVLIIGCNVAEFECVFDAASYACAPLVVELALRLDRSASSSPVAAAFLHFHFDARVCGSDDAFHDLHLIEHKRVASARVNKDEAACFVAQRVSKRALTSAARVQRLPFTAAYPCLMRSLGDDIAEAVDETLGCVQEGLVLCSEKLQHLIVAWLPAL